MRKMSLWALVCVMVVSSALAFWAVSTRYHVISKPWGYVRFDRWTGKGESCDSASNGCIAYVDSQKRGTHTRNIRVKLSDGTEHIFQNTPDFTTLEQVKDRARRDFGLEVIEACCISSQAQTRDAKIAEYLAKQRGFNIAAAREAGYEDAEIIEYFLGLKAPSSSYDFDKMTGTSTIAPLTIRTPTPVPTR